MYVSSTSAYVSQGVDKITLYTLSGGRLAQLPYAGGGPARTAPTSRWIGQRIAAPYDFLRCAPTLVVGVDVPKRIGENKAKGTDVSACNVGMYILADAHR